MLHLPDRRVLLRWMFNILGIVLLFGHEFTVHSVLHAKFWAGLLFGEYTARYYYFLAVVYFWLIPTPLLCWLTAAGLKWNQRWALPVGVGTCGLLLLGFPWVSLAGAVGLYWLITTSSQPGPATAEKRPAKATTDFWNSKRTSKGQQVVLALFAIAGLAIWYWLRSYARRSGMPAWHAGWTAWFWGSAFILFNSAAHEFGHATVAWAVGFQLRVISIGPVTFWREQGRCRFRLDWSRLFDGGGYIGAAPVSDHNLRFNEIAVIAAGPVANALTCLVSVVVLQMTPGSAWQQWWWIPAYNAMIAGVLAVSNLIPVGYCDGTMLFHLIAWTPAGRLLLDLKRLDQMKQEATACHGNASFDREIALYETMLERSLAYGKENAFAIAASHYALGSAYLGVDDWAAADLHFRRCLAFEAEVAASAPLEVNARWSIHLTSVRRLCPAAAETASSSAIACLEKQKAAEAQRRGPTAFALLADVHERNGAFETALREVEHGLHRAPRDSSGIFLRGHLLRTQAACRLHLGEIDRGLAAARSAADLFRSSEIPAASRNLASEEIADLGYSLWRTGQSALPIELLREGIAHLESGNAATVAALYRIKLAAILRQTGRSEEALETLPAEEPQWPALRRPFLAERIQLHLASGHPALAVADGRVLVDLWRAHPCAPALEIASTEALLAKACLAAGDPVEAEFLAVQAAEVLGPWSHPDVASCLITIGLARSHSGDSNSTPIGEAFRRIATAALLTPAEKVRRKDSEMARIQPAPAGVLISPSIENQSPEPAHRLSPVHP